MQGASLDQVARTPVPHLGLEAAAKAFGWFERLVKRYS
jgi:hypothetical protein